MIQTQLLRLEPPYQIIAAGGNVGIQVATLIVTEDKTTPEGGYSIVTHSHPVVNYGLKESNSKYRNNDTADMPYIPESYANELAHSWHLRPEGAVWDKIEISDVYVIGLAGITKTVSMETFFEMIPTIRPGIPSKFPIWNKKTIVNFSDFVMSLADVGMFIKKKDDETVDFYISGIEILANCDPMICITISNEDSFGFYYPLKSDLESEDDSIVLDYTAYSLSLFAFNIKFLFFKESSSITFKPSSPVDDTVMKLIKLVNEHI